MLAQIYGFDWEIYSGQIMPAFSRWLVHEDESEIYQLYIHARIAREEQFTPAIKHFPRIWLRARAFVKRLPRGSHTRCEYQLLCDAHSFTELSDLYVYRHPPRLYRDSEALRILWHALVEHYCRPWFTLPGDYNPSGTGAEAAVFDEQHISHGELISLLQSAGLHELANNIEAQSATTADLDNGIWSEGLNYASAPDAQGIQIGHHPTTLHLRGWLASISVRAMALFELLACGRRSMPFGYRAGCPYENYVGYLTPDEVQQLAISLHDVDAPEITQHPYHDASSQLRRVTGITGFRMIDEILPTHADPFLKVVRMAAQYHLGLLCMIQE